MKVKYFVFVWMIVVIPVCSIGQTSTDLIKQKIVNNYLHYLASKAPSIRLLEEPNYINLDIPSGYKAYLKIQKLDSTNQFLKNDSITLFEFSELGYAYKLVGDSIDLFRGAPYVIEKSGFVVRSGIRSHSGLVGLDHRTNTLYFLNGPLILHDAKWLTVNSILDSINIDKYIRIKHFGTEYKINSIVEYSLGEEYCATIQFKNNSSCIFFTKDRRTGYLEIDEQYKENCKCALVDNVSD